MSTRAAPRRPTGPLSRRVVAVVIGGLICQLGLGYGYAYAHVLVDITEELGWTRSTFASSRLPLMGMMALASPLVGLAVGRAGARPILATAAVLLFLGTTILSAIQEVWHFWLAAAIQGLVAVGLGDVVVGAVISQWVDRGRGLALGIVYAGSNIAGSLLSFALPRMAENVGWREALFVSGAIGAAAILPFALWVLREPRPGERAVPAPAANEPSATGGGSVALNVVAALATRSFWILCFALASFFFVFVGVLDHLVAALRDQGLDRTHAGDLFALITLSSVFAKVGFGALADRIAHRSAMWLQSALFAASTSLLFLVPGASITPWILIVFGVATAARDVIYPLIIDYCFGRDHLAEIYGAVMGLLWVGALGTLFAGQVFDRTGSYEIAFHTFGATATAGFVATLFLRDERAISRPSRSAPEDRS